MMASKKQNTLSTAQGNLAALGDGDAKVFIRVEARVTRELGDDFDPNVLLDAFRAEWKPGSNDEEALVRACKRRLSEARWTARRRGYVVAREIQGSTDESVQPSPEEAPPAPAVRLVTAATLDEKPELKRILEPFLFRMHHELKRAIASGADVAGMAHALTRDAQALALRLAGHSGPKYPEAPEEQVLRTRETIALALAGRSRRGRPSSMPSTAGIVRSIMRETCNRYGVDRDAFDATAPEMDDGFSRGQVARFENALELDHYEATGETPRLRLKRGPGRGAKKKK